MNRGIKNYCKLISKVISKDVNSVININSEDSNYHLVIDLYKSRHKSPIPLSLVYSVTEKDVNTGFGNGFKLNYYKKITVNKLVSPKNIIATNPDGSNDEYSREGTTNYYNNLETHTRIHDCWNDYEIHDSWLYFTDKFNNKYTFDYHYLSYPVRADMSNGDVFNFSVDSTRIYSINNNKGEIITFTYTPTLTTMKVLLNNVEIYKIEFIIDTSKNLTDIKKYKGTNLVGHINFDFQLTAMNKHIISTDNITKHRVKHNFDNQYRVINFKDGFDDSLSLGQVTTIDYYQGYSRVSDYRGRQRYFFFDNEGKLIYAVDEKNRTSDFSYNANKELEKASERICNSKEYIISDNKNLIKNAFFDNGTNEWTFEGTGNATSVIDTSNPITLVGNRALDINCSGTQCLVRQNIVVNGNPNQHLTFAIWAKKTQILSSASDEYAKVRIVVQNNGSIILNKTLLFDPSLSFWQYKSIGLNLTQPYTNVIIEITLRQANTKFRFMAPQLYQKSFGPTQEYDKNGNVIQQYNNSVSSSSNFGSDSRISLNAGFDAETFTYLYDKNGNPIHTTLPHGTILTKVFDSDNRLLSERTQFNNIYMEKENQYDLVTEIKNTKKNTYSNYCGVKTEAYFDELYKIITKIKYPSNTEKDFSYDQFENLIEMIVKNGNDSLGINFEYNSKNLLTKIILPSFEYRISYDENNRPLKISYVNGSSNSDLIETQYLTRSIGGINFNTELTEKEIYGKNGDSYRFTYDDQNRITSVSFISRGSQIETPYFQFVYNEYNQIIRSIDLRIIPNFQTNFTYSDDRKLINISDSENNSIRYFYDLDDQITTKKYSNASIINALSFNNVNRSKGVSPETLSEGLKRSGEYVCFFNSYKKVNDNITVSKDLSKTQLNYLTGNQEYVSIVPSVGTNLSTYMSDSIGYVDYTSSSNERLQYTINTYSGFEFPNSSFMFWFKMSQQQNGNCLLCIGSDETKNQIYVMIENNTLVLYVRDLNKNLTKVFDNVGSIKLNDWNFFGIAFHNRCDGPYYPDTCEYNMQLNGVSKKFTKSDPRLYVDLPLNTPTTVGCKLSGNTQKLKFIGQVTAIRFGAGKYSRDTLDWFYRLTKEYIFKNLYTDSVQKTVYSSSVDQYSIHDDATNLLNTYKVIPLNNSLNSLSGEIPFRYSERPTIYFDKDKQFNFDDIYKRYVYVAEGQELVYNSYTTGYSDSGVITMKVRMTDSIDDNYFFQCNDTNNRTLGLFRKITNNRIYININGTENDTGLTINDTEWRFIGFTWTKVTASGSLTSYSYSIRLRINDAVIERNIPVVYTFTNFKISIGRKYAYSNQTCLPLYGSIEMLMIGGAYVSNTTLTTLKNKSGIFTHSKHYNQFGLLGAILFSNDGVIMPRINYDYKKTGNKYTSLVEQEKIITKTGTKVINYSYNIEDKLIGIIKNGVNYRNFKYNFLGYLIEDNQCFNNNRYTYQYDKLGNISSKQEYLNGSTSISRTYQYTYNTQFPTLLASYDGKPLVYNDSLFGNPTSYGTGTSQINYSWNGKRLVSLTKLNSGLNISYMYDDKGLRIRKTKNELVTKYYYEGKNLIYEVTGTLKKYYYYDEGNNLFGFGLRNGNITEKYYFLRDINGVIIGILDVTGNLVVEYEYDVFGKLISTTGVQADTIGQENNFLYKGYYYDRDTEMYYLKSRYYVPEWGRFLNSDDPRLLSNFSNLTANRNLFCYCNNDPVQNIDENGQGWKEFWQRVWNWIKKLIPVKVDVSTTSTIQNPDGSYVTTTVTKTIVGSSWSFISITVGGDDKGGSEWSVGIGGPLSLNFGSDGISIKGEVEFYKWGAEASYGLKWNGNLFVEVGTSTDLNKDYSTSIVVGKEIDVDWEVVAVVVGLAVAAAVLYVIGTALEAPSFGTSTVILVGATALLLMIPVILESKSEDNFA